MIRSMLPPSSMRRIMLAGCAMVALAACGDDGDAASTTSPSQVAHRSATVIVAAFGIAPSSSSSSAPSWVASPLVRAVPVRRRP